MKVNLHINLPLASIVIPDSIDMLKEEGRINNTYAVSPDRQITKSQENNRSIKETSDPVSSEGKTNNGCIRQQSISNNRNGWGPRLSQITASILSVGNITYVRCLKFSIKFRIELYYTCCIFADAEYIWFF